MSTEQTQTLRNVILQGDCRETLKTVQDESVECVITSPPYLWLRDYGVEGQIGLEKTMNDYLETLWGIFDIIRAKLKPTGTVWVNLGDTYSGMKVGNTNNNMKEGISEMDLVKPRSEIKDKSLMAIPDRFKIGMIDRGWICRNEIIWWKRNAMPSSAKDRFTVDFEKVFFFTKNQKYYFETQYEPYSEDMIRRLERCEKPNPNNGKYTDMKVDGGMKTKASILGSASKRFPKFGGNKAEGYGNPTYSGKEWEPGVLGRLKRTVWDIPTKPFKEAHFATYPEELVKTCMISGCPVGGVTLDPFFGSGTTGVVALKNGRDFIGCELNPEYIKIAEKRLEPYRNQMRL